MEEWIWTSGTTIDGLIELRCWTTRLSTTRWTISVPAMCCTTHARGFIVWFGFPLALAFSFAKNPNIYHPSDQASPYDKRDQLACRSEILDVFNAIPMEGQFCCNDHSCSNDRVGRRLHDLKIGFAPLAIDLQLDFFTIVERNLVPHLIFGCLLSLNSSNCLTINSARTNAQHASKREWNAMFAITKPIPFR